MEIEIAAIGDELGESPVWLGQDDVLLRVDIPAETIVRLDPATGSERRRGVSGHVGFALPTADGGIVAGVERSLVRLDGLDGPQRTLAAVEPGLTGNRFNDAT